MAEPREWLPGGLDPAMSPIGAARRYSGAGNGAGDGAAADDAEARERCAARLAICQQCAHHRTDAEGGPLDPPCGLHGWRPCQWKRQAARAVPAVKDGCLWVNALEKETQ